MKFIILLGFHILLNSWAYTFCFYNPAYGKENLANIEISEVLWQKWLAINYYEKKSQNNYLSQIINKDFFVSPQGYQNPVAEFKVFYDLFLNYKQFKNNAQILCKYPARLSLFFTYYDFIDKKDRPICKDFLEYNQPEYIKSISLIFASGYFDNPSSYWGHILLKINYYPQSVKQIDLDTSLNYGANVTNSNISPLYVINGLFGGYLASYQRNNHFIYSHNYTNRQLRDIWEYELNLSKQQLKFIIEHSFELKNARFRYYFLNDNCANRLAKILENATNLNLTNNHGKWLLPMQVVRNLKQLHASSYDPFTDSPENYLNMQQGVKNTKKSLIPFPRLNQKNAFNSEDTQAYISNCAKAQSHQICLDHLKMGIGINGLSLAKLPFIRKEIYYPSLKQIFFTKFASLDKEQKQDFINFFYNFHDLLPFSSKGINKSVCFLFCEPQNRLLNTTPHEFVVIYLKKMKNRLASYFWSPQNRLLMIPQKTNLINKTTNDLSKLNLQSIKSETLYMMLDYIDLEIAKLTLKNQDKTQLDKLNFSRKMILSYLLTKQYTKELPKPKFNNYSLMTSQRSSNFTIGMGIKNNSNLMKISYRPANNDLFNVSNDGQEISNFTMGQIEGELYQKAWTLSKATIIDILNLNTNPLPIKLSRAFSWGLKLDYDSPNQICTKCKNLGAEAKIGQAKRLNNKILIYALAGARLHSKSYEDEFVNLNGTFAGILTLNDNIITGLSANYIKNPINNNDELTFKTTISLNKTKKFDYRLNIEHNGKDAAIIASIGYYFD